MLHPVWLTGAGFQACEGGPPVRGTTNRLVSWSQMLLTRPKTAKGDHELCS
jgi:hypothetical protein